MFWTTSKTVGLVVNLLDYTGLISGWILDNNIGLVDRQKGLGTS
jgi:hypothetical protein